MPAIPAAFTAVFVTGGATLAQSVIVGATIGAVSGAVTSLIKGENVLKGALRGAVIGGVTAGFTHGFSYGMSGTTPLKAGAEVGAGGGGTLEGLEAGVGEATVGEIGAGIGEATAGSFPRDAVSLATNIPEPISAARIAEATRIASAPTKEGILSGVSNWINENPETASVVGKGLAEGAGAVLESRAAKKNIAAQMELSRLNREPSISLEGLELDVVLPIITRIENDPDWKWMNSGILGGANAQ